jgi:hypothetical protein
LWKRKKVANDLPYPGVKFELPPLRTLKNRHSFMHSARRQFEFIPA